ncbi:hypothetical protein Tco_1164280 [Tanacetum coccineum]
MAAVEDFHYNPDDEEDTRSSHEYLKDLEEEYQTRALLAKSKRFFKKVLQLPVHPQAKNKGLIAETYDWDEEEVSSDENEVIEVKALMALANEETISVTKESLSNDYLCIDLNYVEEQKNNLMTKHRNLVQELNTCKEQLLVLKQAKLDLLTMQHVNTKILKENQNLRNELKEITSITKAWLNSYNKVNQCINEQISTQKKKILGIDQLTENTSISRLKDLMFVKSSTDNSEVSITGSNKPKLSEAEDSTLSNHDTGKVPLNETQRNTTDHSVVVSDSSATDCDSADESLVYSTPLPLLEKLTGAEPVSRPKTVKSILKSKSTFKVVTLKGIIINEPSSAPARGNKSSLVSKNNSAPAGKLKNVKIEDDPPLAIVMKELNELKLKISKNKSSYFKNKNSQQLSLCASCVREIHSQSCPSILCAHQAKRSQPSILCHYPWTNGSSWDCQRVMPAGLWSWCGWTRVRRKGNSTGGFGGMWERMNSNLFTGCRFGDLARTVPERVICYYRDGPCSFQIWPLKFLLGLHR